MQFVLLYVRAAVMHAILVLDDRSAGMEAMVSASASSQSVKRKYCAASEQLAKNFLINCMWEELAWDARSGLARIPMDWTWIRRSAIVRVSVLHWWPLLLLSHCVWASFCNLGCIFEMHSMLHEFENNNHHSLSTVHGGPGFAMKAFPQSVGRPF